MIIKLENLVLHGEEMDADKNPPIFLGPKDNIDNYRSNLAFSSQPTSVAFKNSKKIVSHSDVKINFSDDEEEQEGGSMERRDSMSSSLAGLRFGEQIGDKVIRLKNAKQLSLSSDETILYIHMISGEIRIWNLATC